jgi:hypothetical protein
MSEQEIKLKCLELSVELTKTPFGEKKPILEFAKDFFSFVTAPFSAKAKEQDAQ